MEQYRQKYREYLDKMLEGVDPEDNAQHEEALAKLRASNERMLAKDPRLQDSGRAQLMRDALEDVIRERSSPPADDDALQPAEEPTAELPPPQAAASTRYAPPNRSRDFLIGLAAGAVGAIVILGLVAATGTVSLLTGASAQRAQLFEENYQASLPQLEAASSYLRQIEEEVLRRQREEPAALTDAAGESFLPLYRFDGMLTEQMPDNLPRGSNISVRANATAYKIIMAGPLCRIAFIAQPDLVDPRRVEDGLNCFRIALWNDEGAEF